MPLLESMPFPTAVKVVHALLSDIAPVVLRVPADFDPPLIVIKRVGGQPDVSGITDEPIMLVATYGATYDEASDLMDQVEVRILTSPMTEVDGVLIDGAGIYVGEQEVPDVYPDDRRITATYQFAWRRQFRP